MGSKFKVSLVRRCKKHEQASALHSTEYLECMIIPVAATWYSTISTGRKFQSTSKKDTSATSCFRLPWVVSPMYHLPKVAWIEKSSSWARSPVKPLGESPGHWSRIVLLATFWRSWIAGDVSMIGRKGERSIATIGIIELSGSIGKLSCSPDPSNLRNKIYIFGRGSLSSLHLPYICCSFVRGWVIEWNLTDLTSGNCNTESLLIAGWEKSTDNTISCNFLRTDIGALVFALTHGGCLSIERLFVLPHVVLQIGISLRRLQLKDSQVQNLAVFHK